MLLVQNQEKETVNILFSLYPSLEPIYSKLLKWMARFPYHEDHLFIDQLLMFYLIAGKKYINHRSPSHIARTILAFYFLQKKLFQGYSSSFRHFEVKWISARLVFPFSSKPVLGCLIGFNLMDRYEVFDEENILLILQKHLPQFLLVEKSFYSQVSSNKDLRIFYFEVEKCDGTTFSLDEQIFVKQELTQRLKNSIQRLSPTIFMTRNEEEVYKNILTLSQEIQSIRDLPQVIISLEKQTKEEAVFLITMVYISSSRSFSFPEHLLEGFASERFAIVKYIEKRPVEAHIFRVHLKREAFLLRSDGSLDFYAARQKVSEYITEAIGEFRDYNGGIIIKQSELLQSLKQSFPKIAYNDSELIETFFYAITPLEKQAVLRPEILAKLFSYFIASYEEKMDGLFSLKIYPEHGFTAVVLRVLNASAKNILKSFLQSDFFSEYDTVYNLIENEEKLYFQCIFFSISLLQVDSIFKKLEQNLIAFENQIQGQRVLRIGFDYSLLSLDPRIGGEGLSQVISGLLFEGLTRFDSQGNVTMGVAEKIDISSDYKRYVFHLRPCLWSNGSYVSAFDFEYAWKKVLTPDFKTSFAYLFNPIEGAQEAKEGRLSMKDVGIRALNDTTLRVDLKKPTPYFLELTSHPIYSPIHRLIDQRYPQWPYQADKSYLCNGAFLLKTNQPEQVYTLEKNSHYWDARHIHLDQVIFNRMTP